MTDFRCLERIPVGSLESASKVLAFARWHIRVERTKANGYIVRTGESPLLITDSSDVADAFLLGMALAISDLPHELLNEYRRRMLHDEGHDSEPTVEDE